jgi:hypothetical protein
MHRGRPASSLSSTPASEAAGGGRQRRGLSKRREEREKGEMRASVRKKEGFVVLLG